MTSLDRVDERNEGFAEQGVVVHIDPFAYGLEEVATPAEVHDNVEVVVILVCVVYRNDVGVVRDKPVKSDLSTSGSELGRLPPRFADHFYGAGSMVAT